MKVNDEPGIVQGNGEEQYYSPSQVSVSSGSLVITSDKSTVRDANNKSVLIYIVAGPFGFLLCVRKT